MAQTVLLLWAAAPASFAEDADATGWIRIPGGPDTGCAPGTPYAFYLRPGSPEEVMVYFQGGGACWNDRTCDPGGESPYDPVVDELDHPSRMSGVFDFGRADNPLRDYTVLFVPYCTGDVHLGARTVEYSSLPREGAAAEAFTLHHRGARNVASALKGLKDRNLHPKKLFVAGTSAGAIPSPLYAARLARDYPGATVVQLADGAGGYRGESMPDVLQHWGATGTMRATFPDAAIEGEAQGLKDLYVLAGRQAPSIRYAQFNYAEDDVQLFFLQLLGVADTPLTPLLGANLADMRRSVPWFRAYTAPGEAHGILGSEAFYTLTVDGVRLRDWVADLAGGREVEDVGEGLFSAGRQAGSHGHFKLVFCPFTE